MWPLRVLLGIVGAAALGVILFRLVFVPWGMRWGATPAEREAVMAGDALLEEDAWDRRRLVMTRATSVGVWPETVWHWVAQLGRGAGFYSYDRIDNGGKTSARHIVSWVPTLALGDASAIGYLRHVEPGVELVWWVPGERFLGAETRMVIDARLAPDADRTRLTIRVSGDARGRSARPVLWLFAVVDSLMARRQLLGIRDRAEAFGARLEDPERPETGARDQFQRYEVVFAAGDRAGVPGKERAGLWHERAIHDLGARFGSLVGD